MAKAIRAHSLNTPLKSRILWYDGESSYTPQALAASWGKGIKYVTEITPEIAEYNRNVTSDREFKVKTEATVDLPSWKMPEEYAALDVFEYVVRLHTMLFNEHSDFEERERRLVEELITYQRMELFDVLRAIIWIINTLTLQDTVWGVGRGSSVSSYVLYVIGVHDVDSFMYDLDVEDFLRP